MTCYLAWRIRDTYGTVFRGKQRNLQCHDMTYLRNPNLIPIGNGFGFLVFIKDIEV